MGENKKAAEATEDLKAITPALFSSNFVRMKQRETIDICKVSKLDWCQDIFCGHWATFVIVSGYYF